jgi:magnesium-transporting ATPase (P-type)
VLQLLWVNLIMDTMGALALATEDPNPDLLNDKVHACWQQLPSQFGLHACSQKHCWHASEEPAAATGTSPA